VIAAVAQPVSTVFRNVRIFNGTDPTLSEPSDVTVTGSLITQIDPATATPAPQPSQHVIDGRGKTLIPGLIDAHVRLMFAALAPQDAFTADESYIHIAAAANAEAMLLRGFTTVRDAGGPTFGLKRAIDEGIVPGPRIYPSGAFISQSGGHGDFRLRNEIPRGRVGHLSSSELGGAAVIADGEAAVLQGAREQLMLGATQIKVMAGGGAISTHDPLDVTQYTERELRAAVDAAENWGTYVLAHAYTPRSVQQAVRAGVRSIEHGHLLDEHTVALIAETQTWWSLQAFFDDEDKVGVSGPSAAKAQTMIRGTDNAYELGIKHRVRIAWGTDTLYNPGAAQRQGMQLTKLRRWFTPAEVLAMATSTNAELLAMSGPRNPYAAPLGVINVGALADLILVDGNPLDNLDLIATPHTSFTVIMKNGELIKSEAAQA
jgi:imidazolonepropionase-like amidohydrolase